MAEMITCPACGVDTAMERESAGWRCPDCDHVFEPTRERKDDDLEGVVHTPPARSEDD